MSGGSFWVQDWRPQSRETRFAERTISTSQVSVNIPHNTPSHSMETASDRAILHGPEVSAPERTESCIQQQGIKCCTCCILFLYIRNELSCTLPDPKKLDMTYGCKRVFQNQIEEPDRQEACSVSPAAIPLSHTLII